MRKVILAFTLILTAYTLLPTISFSQTPGSLDPSFDTDGKLVTSIGGANDEGFSVAVQPDENIYYGGNFRCSAISFFYW